MNTGLEEAALTTARALQDISAHWDKVYEAIRRRETTKCATRGVVLGGRKRRRCTLALRR